MANSKQLNRDSTSRVADPERWRQHIRLACIEAVSRQVVSAREIYNADRVILAAKRLESFVVRGD